LFGVPSVIDDQKKGLWHLETDYAGKVFRKNWSKRLSIIRSPSLMTAIPERCCDSRLSSRINTPKIIALTGINKVISSRFVAPAVFKRRK